MTPLALEDRQRVISEAIHGGARLGFITSINGKQIITALLFPQTGKIECLETEISGTDYPSLTVQVPQAHWFERVLWDMFGLHPRNHPRLKRTHLHEPFEGMAPPLAADREAPNSRAYSFLRVEGEGLYEIPVGPIHAGIIEPGHFRFSCYGEVITNLEIRLGYVHRGIEKRLTEIPWQKSRFVVESAASDMAVANAMANSTAIESLFDIKIPWCSMLLRTMATETERIAMHISDLSGIAADIAFLGVASAFARTRGIALGIGDLLAGNRLMRGFICPGGITRPFDKNNLAKLKTALSDLQNEFKTVTKLFLNNQVAMERMDGVGRVSPRLALDFGLVGVTARASGIAYDCRKHWSYSLYPKVDFPIAVTQAGDVLGRTKIRIEEVNTSLALLSQLLEQMVETSFDTFKSELPKILPKNQSVISVVESHRGELIHFITTDDTGSIKRYHVKDPSVNNWTALAVAVRNHVVADFPLCNKSFSLSYSGHDM